MNARRYIALYSSIMGLALSLTTQAVEITTTNLPNSTMMEPYSFTLEGTGVESLNWNIAPLVTTWPSWTNPGLDEFLKTESDFEEIIFAPRHALALTHTGTVFRVTAYDFAMLDNVTDIIAVAAGYNQSIFLKSNGRVSVSGGSGSPPVGLSGVTAIAAGYEHGMALTESGEIYTWGDNSKGQCDVPAELYSYNVTAISGGEYFSLALKSDGTVSAWGSNSDGQLDVPADLSHVTKISAGQRHALALKDDGTIIAWGSHALEECNVPLNLTNVVSIAAGSFCSAALQADGQVITWGNRKSAPLPNVQKLTSSFSHMAAYREPGTALPRGLSYSYTGAIYGTPKETGTFSITSSLRDANGDVASRTFELVIATNPNLPPQLVSKEPATDLVEMTSSEELTFSVQVTDPESAPLSYRWTLANGTVVSTNNTCSFTTDDIYSTTKSLVCYVSDDLWEDQIIAQWDVRRTSYKLVTETLPTGREMEDYSFQLETTSGDFYLSTLPELKLLQTVYSIWSPNFIPDNAQNIVQIKAGYYHALVLRSDGTVVSWGLPLSTDPYWVHGNGIGDIQSIGVGSYHNLAVKTDGTVEAWGYNYYGQCDVPEGLLDVVQVTGGFRHSLALKSDGAVVAWGDNEWGQLDIPAGLSNVVQIAAGYAHNLALTANGTVVAWGYNDDGRCNVPQALGGVTKVAVGRSANLVLFDDGTVWGWGSGWDTDLQNSENILYNATGGVQDLSVQHSQFSAVRHDGSFVLWGETPNMRSKNDPWSYFPYADELVSGADFRLAWISPEHRLPPGLKMDSDGLITGVPEEAGTYRIKVLISEAINNYTSRSMEELELVIEPQANLRPTITNTIPASAGFLIDAGTNAVCSLEANDPESAPLSYRWVLDGIEVATGTVNYNYQSSILDTGDRELYCYVSDDLWDEVVFYRWTIGMEEDNDHDGMSNVMEVGLARNPNDPNDGGNTAISLSGSVWAVHGGIIPKAEVELCGADGTSYYDVECDTNGQYRIEAIETGTYYLRAGADFFADEWHDNALNIAAATPVLLTAGAIIENVDFVLDIGQNPSFAEITSDPSGAMVYMNGHALPLTTPATVNMGELYNGTDQYRSPVFTVKLDGYAIPAPQYLYASETQTIQGHFKLNAGTNTGSVVISTTPEGSDVYVDYMDVPAFTTPVMVTNLLAGEHIVTFRKEGYLIPQPVSMEIEPGTNNLINLQLTAIYTSNEIHSVVKSIPPDAQIYINYLPSTNQTDAIVSGLDSSDRYGSGWNSESHVFHLKKAGYIGTYGRYISEETDGNEYTVHLMPDTEISTDLDLDGLPDEWETAYQLRSRAPTANGAHDDPDDDGANNEDELRAGTNPLMAESVFEVAGITPGASETTVEFKTVPGNTYLVLHSDSLEGPWTAGTVITATANTTSYAIPEGEAATSFIKVILLKP